MGQSVSEILPASLSPLPGGEERAFTSRTDDTPTGGLLYAAGNGIVRGTPLENIETFLDECLTYGNS